MPQGQAGDTGDWGSGHTHTPSKVSHFSGLLGLAGVWSNDAKCSDFPQEILIFM